jgi:serine/threonine-protein kinase OSR1/STK39
MAMCKHANISSFYTSFICERDVWLVMPIYEGGSVTDILQYRFKSGIKDVGVIAAILKEVLQALMYLHNQGQIHRDVKCSNILLNLEGQVFLGDFGICAIIKEGPRAQTFAGTPCWMAPEVLTAETGYDYKADIWSVGICALELAEGRAPHADLVPMKVRGSAMGW